MIDRENLHIEIQRLKSKSQKRATAPVIMSVLGCSERVAKKIAKRLVANDFNPVDYDAVILEIEDTCEDIPMNGSQEELDFKNEQESTDGSTDASFFAAIDPNVVPLDIKAKEGEWAARYSNDEKYYYDKTADMYVCWFKGEAGGKHVFPAQKIRDMYKDYTNWSGQRDTINEICRKHEFPRAFFNELKAQLNWTQDDVPVTKEQFKDIKDDELVAFVAQLEEEKQLTRKMVEVKKMTTDFEWQSTERDAKLWKEFQAKKLEPFCTAIQNYTPKPFPPILSIVPNNVDKLTRKNTFLIGLSDIHFGALSYKEDLGSGVTYDHIKQASVIDDYARKIYADVCDRNYVFNKAIVCVLGDILHSLSGYTENETKLEAGMLGTKQYEFALDLIIKFTFRIIEIFGNVEVHMIKGNHAGPSEYILFRHISDYFRNDPKIKFIVYRQRSAVFKEGNTILILDHGASEVTKNGKIPSDTKGRENYISKRLQEQPDLLSGAKTKLLIQGDKHHCEYQEYFSGCEFFMFSSPVSGDKYADHLALHSRPRQNALILSEDGVKEHLSYYFD